jgi:hypothetical protein
MNCKCTSCFDCNGSGTVWRSWAGEYLGNSRCDDLDELLSCDSCGGSGIDYYCEECQQAELDAEQEEEERYRLERNRDRP